MDQAIAITLIIVIAILILGIVFAIAWVKREQQRTLQKVLEREDVTGEELLARISHEKPQNQDFRRGLFLVVGGLSLGAIFFFLGGTAWMLALIPIASGAVYLILASLKK